MMEVFNMSNSKKDPNDTKKDLEDKSNIDKLFIDELRHTLGGQEKLSNALDSKAAVFFGLSSVTLSVIISSLISLFSTPLSLSSQINMILQITFFGIFLILVLMIIRGLVYLLEFLKVRKYSYPFTVDPNEMVPLINQDYEDLKDDLIIDYRKSIPHHYCINNRKSVLLVKGMKWIKVGFIVSFILLMIMICIKMFGGVYGQY